MTRLPFDLAQAARQDRKLPPHLRRRLSQRQVADILGITRQAMNSRIMAGYTPDGRDTTGRPYWYIGTVLEWDIVPDVARRLIFEEVAPSDDLGPYVIE